MTVTLAERLTAYVARHYAHHIAMSAGKPWTFRYRQWTNEVGDKCSQCTGVTVDLGDGQLFTHTVADMDTAAQQAIEAASGQSEFPLRDGTLA